MTSRADGRLRPGWWALIFVAVVAAFVFVTMARFTEAFDSSLAVVVTSDRVGLVMDPGAAVKLRGVKVGEVKDVQNRYGSVRLDIGIDRDQVDYIPANVAAQIRATTLFGAKYLDLVYPSDPSREPLRAGAVIAARNVSTEVNTVFENLVDLLQQIDPAKLNGVLTALSEGFRGQGPRIGEAITDSNDVLLECKPRAEN